MLTVLLCLSAIIYTAAHGTAKEKRPAKFGGLRFERLPLPLIMHGKVLDDNLRKVGQTRFWLKNRLREKGVRDIRTVAVATIDHQGRIFTLLHIDH